MQIQILGKNNNVPKNIHIALDTCVFINAFKNPLKFKDFFVYLADNGNIPVTTYLNYLEFSKGHDTMKEFFDIQNWFDQIVEYVYPLRDLTDWVEKLKLAYRRDGQSVGITDLFLSALAMKYKDQLMILSKDHGDFMTDLFEIQAYIPYLASKRNVETYCLYKFSMKKYSQKLLDLEKTPQ